MAKFDDKGRELLDDTPVEMPVGFKRPESIHEMVRRYIRTEAFRQKMEEAGLETEEEANDFDVDEEESDVERFISRHELSAMAADELRDLTAKEEFDRMRASFKGGDKNGRNESEERVGRAGQSRETGKADGKPKSSAVAGDRKETAGTAESEGG